MDGRPSAHLSLPRVRILSTGERLTGVSVVSEHSFEMVFIGVGEKGLIPLTTLRRCGDESQMLLILAERAALLVFYRIEESFGRIKTGMTLWVGTFNKF